MEENAQAPQYIGVKIVHAQPMGENDFNDSEGRENAAEPREGYKVTYENGYVTWSPKDAFDAAYRQLDNGSMNFGLAIEALKKGKKVARKGWNGKGMFLELQVRDEHSKMTVSYPYFTIPNCEEGTRLIPYSPTLIDIMSDDWFVVELDEETES